MLRVAETELLNAIAKGGLGLPRRMVLPGSVVAGTRYSRQLTGLFDGQGFVFKLRPAQDR